MNTKTPTLLIVLASTTVILSFVVGIQVLERRSRQVKPASSQLAEMSSTTSPRSEQKRGTSRSLEDRRDLADRLRQKLLAQGNTPTFFDNVVQAALEVQEDDRGADQRVKQEAERLIDLFDQLLEAKRDRFCSYEERIDDLCPLTGTKKTVSPQSFIISQGTHSVVKWRQYDVFKSTFDLAIYWMIMDEIKPQVIVELGSGPGGSAVWFADMASALGFDTHVYSYDIKKPDIVYPNVTFIEYDLEGISSTNPLPFKERFVGTVLVSEDAHVNVRNVLLEIDSILDSGDYLIVEDSFGKQRDISEFLELTNKTYRVDRYYTDFFGKNGTSAVDSIFKAF